MKYFLLALVPLTGHTGPIYDVAPLGEAIYHESRGEPLVCKIVTAQSILNRVDQDRFPNTVEEVVHQKTKKDGIWVCQYSYYCDDISDELSEPASRLDSYEIAAMTLMADIPDLSNGADHYYAYEKVKPDWADDLEDSFICGKHRYGRLEW